MVRHYAPTTFLVEEEIPPWDLPLSNAPIDWSDPFDPRTWDDNPDNSSPVPWITFVVGSERGVEEVLVSREDEDLARSFNWCLNRKNIHDPTPKTYISRAETGVARGASRRTFYLHREVMARICPPPTYRHCLVDHLNGDSLDNRRTNLRWATPSQNNRNKFGFIVRQQTFTFARELQS